MPVSDAPRRTLLGTFAAGWRVIDDLTWEFALRRGFAFHEGTPCTAADAACSFARPGRLERSASSCSRYSNPASHTAASRAGIEVRLWPGRRFNALLVRPASRP